MSPDNGGCPWDARRFAWQLGALGERVRASRTSQGWSQLDLGNRAEMDRADLSRIESGRKNITLEVLWRLARALEVHWADLLDDRRTSPPAAPYTSASFGLQLRTFGIRAYQARVLQRLYQQVLADRTGIARSAISWIEDGAQNVTLETLSRLAAGLRVHWADLLDDRQTHPPPPDRARNDGAVSGTADQAERGHHPNLRQAAEALAAAFDRYDRPRLAELSTAQRTRHLLARRLLADYLDQMWHDTQPPGSDPAQQSAPTSIAALRHVTHRLLTAARDGQQRRDGDQQRPGRPGRS